MSNQKRRIMKELDDMSKDVASGVRFTIPNSDNLQQIRGIFTGPPDTPYAGGTFEIDIQLPENYPFVPPKMKFITRVWHPNVSSMTGAICLDTLATKWTPVLTIKTALLSLQSLLAAPEPTDPQDAEVAKQMLEHPAEYREKAAQWARLYANADSASISEEERQRRLLDGYLPEVVDHFEQMGFDKVAVVNALRAVGAEKGERISEDKAGRVVERLCGMA
ncbi:ubiquitin-conjugating enzyme/RWD-like protein [Pyronema domesticum]|uniref:Ubiquitin-conjugating enzyme E2 1 n=1 Tax=Pyronema omphalodes (strain CBS 100304) TaxID=1076935 RepID=U4LL75_PYROM|nr:ubiquitin-conjugating enzyme/RWD-like protein [Pyronema domesticum]CCX32307.1 Similar to Ubiquitin-conjugating enzyme E2 1; acc. no. P21734 [Pyronema omphalodes CBS 100304]